MKKKSLLWQLSGSELPGNSYLFGTMHVHDSRAFALMPLLEKYIAACDRFVAEYNLAETREVSEEVLQLLASPIPWAEQLGERKFQKIRRILKKTTGIDVEQYRKLLPFFIVQQLSHRILPFQEDMPLDLRLFTYAEKLGKELAGIESWEGQFNYIQNIPIEKQIKMLVDFARHPASVRKQYKRLIALYQQQDIYRLHRSLKKQSGHYRKKLLYERNFKMADRIHELCQTGRTFTAVGAGHLTGGKGLIRLLKHKGLTVKAVLPDPELVPSSSFNES